VLTGFDMLMLRAYYAPELRNGSTVEEAAAAIPGILARLNPGGGRGAIAPPDPTPRAWVDAIEEALGARTAGSARLAAARRAVEIAEAEGWREHRYAFSLFTFGRLSLANRGELALASFLQASHIWQSSRVTEVQAAYVGMQLSAFALSTGDHEATLGIVNSFIPVAARAENAALLASLLMVKAEALDLAGRRSEAEAVRLDSLAWARYGFGPDEVVRARLGDIAALSPANAL